MGFFSAGRVKKKYCCVRGDHYMKNKNIGGVFCQLNLISKKGPNAKMRKKCKKLSNIEKIFLARFAHSAVYKIHISGAANKFIFLELLTNSYFWSSLPPCPSLICKICFFLVFFFVCFCFLFFLSSHHDTNLYFICIIFVKNIVIYWLILTVNHQASYFPLF